ncbi:MAG: hypothetical protein DRQ08_03185 [Candidatus Latescibacterota bacterium]|nr:MAG: hypothetical protein DRQ08_03185 [Candidatus Latescibacterota bacterium]
MEEQARHLRELFSAHRNASERRAKSFTVTSGKGGVGKSNLALNLSLAFAELGRKVFLVDADVHLANLDVLLGMKPDRTLRDFVLGECPLEEVIVQGPMGLSLVPASSGVTELLMAEDRTWARLEEALTAIEEEADVVVVDTAAGLSRGVLDMALSTDDVVVVTTPEPTAVVDAYAMVKVISSQREEVPIHLVINRVRSQSEAEEVFGKLNQVIKHFLGLKVMFSGFVLEDPRVSKAVAEQRPFLLAYPGSKASSCVRRMARRLSGMPEERKGSWIRRLSILRNKGGMEL